MSVRIKDEMVLLTGRCLAEDAEALLVALQENPELPVDLTAATRLHLAVVQILLAAGPQIHGTPDNLFAARHVLGLLQ